MLRIDHTALRANGSFPSFTYQYCVSENALTLRAYPMGATYTFERRYLSGNADACLARSVEACEDLDGCHQGSCRGAFADCALAETQTECEDVANATPSCQTAGRARRALLA